MYIQFNCCFIIFINYDIFDNTKKMHPLIIFNNKLMCTSLTMIKKL